MEHFQVSNTITILATSLQILIGYLFINWNHISQWLLH